MIKRHGLTRELFCHPEAEGLERHQFAYVWRQRAFIVCGKKRVLESRRKLCHISERQLSGQSVGTGMINHTYCQSQLLGAQDSPESFTAPKKLRYVSFASLPMSGGSVPSSRGEKKRVSESRRKLCHILTISGRHLSVSRSGRQ